jgi:hypothetical protein
MKIKAMLLLYTKFAQKLKWWNNVSNKTKGFGLLQVGIMQFFAPPE